MRVLLNYKTRMSAAAALLALTLASGAWAKGKTDSQYPLGTFDIAWAGATCSAPIAIAAINGYYAEQGLNVTLVTGGSFEANRELVTTLLRSYHFDRRNSDTENTLAKDDALYFADWLTKIDYLPRDLNVQQFVDNAYVDVFALEKKK